MNISAKDLNLIQRVQNLLEDGCYEQAVDVLDVAITQGSVEPELLHLKGLACSFARDFESARHWIKQAIASAGERWLYVKNLGVIHYQMGELELAVECFNKAIQLAPNDYETYGFLTDAQKFRQRPLLLDTIERLLKNGLLNKAQRSNLHFAAGKVYDDIGQLEQAIHHFHAANQAASRPADVAAIERQAEAVISAVTTDTIEQAARSGVSSALPVFVVGMPRSGTSLLEQIITAHANGFGVGESLDMEDSAARLDEVLVDLGGYPQAYRHAGPEVIRELGESYLEHLTRLTGKQGPGDRIVNSMPMNFWHLGLIASLFPRGHIIHIRRDPRDTCLSCYFTNFVSGLNFTFDLDKLLQVYGIYERLLTHWNRVIPDRMITVDYEDLVNNTAGEARKIIAFLGLEWDENCTRPQRSRNPVQSASAWQVRQPVYNTSVGRWKKYESVIGPCKLQSYQQ